MPLEEDELYQSEFWTTTRSRSTADIVRRRRTAYEDENPLCGDVVRVELAIEPDGTVRDAYFNGDGCCISQASASMLVEQINGKPLDDIKRFTARDMLDLFGAKLTPNRQKCCLLCWRRLAIGRLFARCTPAPRSSTLTAAVRARHDHQCSPQGSTSNAFAPTFRFSPACCTPMATGRACRWHISTMPPRRSARDR